GREVAIFHEVSRTRFGEQIDRQPSRLVQVRANGERVLNQVARMTCAKVHTTLLDVVDDVCRKGAVERDVLVAAIVLENLDEFVNGRRFRQHLVLNAAQKRFVEELGGLQVRGKHHKGLERNLEFLPGSQRQKVDTAFERHDPAAQ